jgi:hypothetical protein
MGGDKAIPDECVGVGGAAAEATVEPQVQVRLEELAGADAPDAVCDGGANPVAALAPWKVMPSSRQDSGCTGAASRRRGCSKRRPTAASSSASNHAFSGPRT